MSTSRLYSSRVKNTNQGINEARSRGVLCDSRNGQTEIPGSCSCYWPDAGYDRISKQCGNITTVRRGHEATYT